MAGVSTLSLKAPVGGFFPFSTFLVTLEIQFLPTWDFGNLSRYSHAAVNTYPTSLIGEEEWWAFGKVGPIGYLHSSNDIEEWTNAVKM